MSNGPTNGGGVSNVAVQLVINLLADGSINVTGPIDNKLLCDGMLEGAKDAIRDYVKAKANPGIVRANGMPPVAGPRN